MSEFLFVVDTDSFSGSFEREMCKYMTGDGDRSCLQSEIYPTTGYFNNGMGGNFKNGDEKAALAHFKKAIAEYNKTYNTKLEDVFQKHPAYQSVAIFFSSKPTAKQIKLLKSRAKTFAKLEDIEILDFKLIEETTKEQSL